MGCGSDKFDKYDKFDNYDNYDNYIFAEININKYNINKDIKIINSFENAKKENYFEDIK